VVQVPARDVDLVDEEGGIVCDECLHPDDRAELKRRRLRRRRET